jgi:hypothetical protein
VSASSERVMQRAGEPLAGGDGERRRWRMRTTQGGAETVQVDLTLRVERKGAAQGDPDL